MFGLHGRANVDISHDITLICDLEPAHELHTLAVMPRNLYLGFRNGQGQRDGFGVMQLEDGPTYTGQWSGSKREGHGTLFFEGGVFEGQWLAGQAHGKGVVHFKNGDSFQGNYAQLTGVGANYN